MQNRLGHVLALPTQNCLSGSPGFLTMALDGFSALQFVPPAPKLLAEKTNSNFLQCILPPHFPVRAFKQCHLK